MSRPAFQPPGSPFALPLVRVSVIQPFLAWLEHEGIPRHSYLHRAGLPGEPEEFPQAFVAGLPVRELLADLARREAGPALGWRVGDVTEARELGPLVRVLPACRNLGDSIGAFCRELRRDSPSADFGLLLVPSGAWFWRRPGPGVRPDLMEQYVAVMMVKLVRVVAGHGWNPRRVRLQAPQVDAMGRALLGDPEITLGAALTAIHLPSDTLALPVDTGALRGGAHVAESPGANAELIAALRQVLPMALSGAPGIDWGAAATGLSRRTLQRRLSERGLTWATLLDEVRMEVACRELETSRRSVREVARRTGYRDAANFTRAFRRWTGSTPREFRGALRGDV